MKKLLTTCLVLLLTLNIVNAQTKLNEDVKIADVYGGDIKTYVHKNVKGDYKTCYIVFRDAQYDFLNEYSSIWFANNEEFLNIGKSIQKDLNDNFKDGKVTIYSLQHLDTMYVKFMLVGDEKNIYISIVDAYDEYSAIGIVDTTTFKKIFAL